MSRIFKHDIFEEDLCIQYSDEGVSYYLPATSDELIATLEISEEGYNNLKAIVDSLAAHLAAGVVERCTWGRITLTIPGVTITFTEDDAKGETRYDDEEPIIPESHDVWVSYDEKELMYIGITHPDGSILLWEISFPWDSLVSYFSPEG